MLGEDVKFMYWRNEMQRKLEICGERFSYIAHT